MNRFKIVVCSLLRYWHYFVPLTVLWVAMFLFPLKGLLWLVLAVVGIRVLFFLQYKQRLMTGVAIGTSYEMNSYLPMLCNYKSPKSMLDLLRDSEIILLDLNRRTSYYSSMYMFMCFLAYSARYSTLYIPKTLTIYLRHKDVVESVQNHKLLLRVLILPFFALYVFRVAMISPALAFTLVVPVCLFDIITSIILDAISIDVFLNCDNKEVTEKEILEYRAKSKMFEALCIAAEDLSNEYNISL